MAFEDHLIFFPSKYPAGEWRSNGLGVEDAWFSASDGTKLHGWYRAHPNPRGVVLFCHGNAGNITHRADLIRGMHDVAGCSVLVFDYRGYGRSEGNPNEAGVLADGRAARAWLAQREGIPEEQIVLMGESLGGAVAVDLAAEKPGRALVLENTFNRLDDVAAFHYCWLPVRWLMRTEFNSEAKIGRYTGPLLQFHGDRDTIVPYRFGCKLFAAANEPKKLVTVLGGDHNDGHRPDFFARVREFLDSLPAMKL